MLQALFDRKTDQELIQLNTKQGDLKDTWRTYYVHTPDEAYQFAIANQHLNVYFGVAPRLVRDNAATAVGRVLFMFQDIDFKGRNNDPYTGLEKLRLAYPLPPSYVVSSGNGLHVYWRIEPLDNHVVFRNVIGTLCKRVRGDNGAIGITTVLRVPGSFNHKDENNVLPVEIIEKNDFFTYKAEELCKAAEVGYDINRLIYTGDTETFAGDRSQRDWNVILPLMRAGLSEPTIRHIFSTMPVGDRFLEDLDTKQRSNGDYLTQTIAKANESGVVSSGDITNSWSIVAKDDCYYFVRPNGMLDQITTFVFEPTKLLEGDITANEEDTIIGNIHSENEVWHNMTFSRKAFNSVTNLQQQLLKIQWQILGTDKQVRLLLPYLTEQLKEHGGGVIPSQRATPVIGRHEGYFIGPRQTIGAGDKIVWLPTQREHPDVDYIESENTTAVLQAFCNLYFSINELHIVWAALGWYIAALFKPVLKEQKVNFPILNIYGTRGSGKTTLIETLQRLVGYITPTSYTSETKYFVFMCLMASTNAIPISIDEFRAKRGGQNFGGMFRIAYDTGRDSRGRPDQTTVSYPLTAPINVTGEDPMSDAALVERSIQFNLRPDTIQEGSDCYYAYAELSKVNLNEISHALITWSLTYTKEWQQAFDYTFTLYANVIPDRVRRNLATVIWGIQAFCNFCLTQGVEIDEPDYAMIIMPVLNHLVNLKSGRTRLAVDGYIEMLVNAAAMGEKDFIWDTTSGFFYFQHSSAYVWWLAQSRRMDTDTFESNAIIQQMRERTDEYLLPYSVRYSAKLGMSMQMYGVNLIEAQAMGLDVPDSVVNEFKINVKD